MKTNLFIGLSLLISFQAIAQYKNAIPVKAPYTENLNTMGLKEAGQLATFKQNHAAKKHKRSNTVWYNIVDYMGATQGIPVADLYSYHPYMGAANPNPNGRMSTDYLWPDSTMRLNGASSSGINWMSIGQVLDPTAHTFQDLIAFPDVNIGPANTYQVDSFALLCSYRRKPAQAAVVDTLILSFVTEDNNNLYSYLWTAGAVNANYGADTIAIQNQVYDTLAPKPIVQKNVTGGGAPLIIKKVLDQAAANDTIAGGWNYYKIAPNITVPAGKTVSVSVSFKPGTTWVPFVDTIEQFNNLRFLSHEENLYGFFTYTKWDYNSSNVVYKFSDAWGWGGSYIPAIGFTDNFRYEFHNMDWLLTCLNCGPVASDDEEEMMNYTVSPNPATDHVQFSFSLKNSANDVSISLSNLLGQQVKSMELGAINANITRKASMSISDLPAGLYICTINTDGKKSTNKILVNR